METGSSWRLQRGKNIPCSGDTFSKSTKPLVNRRQGRGGSPSGSAGSQVQPGSGKEAESTTVQRSFDNGGEDAGGGVG